MTKVSIHAPTRGATTRTSPTGSKSCFNPRTHTGCDNVRTKLFAYQAKFQSTHPHGVRHSGLSSSLDNALVSIHAPTRGATVWSLPSHERANVSIHAPTRGATREMYCCISAILSFNPRTHTGCDMVQRRKRHLLPSFNPRTHTGCDSE